MNTLFVLLDGAEDHPHELLGGKKPIHVAEMPFMRSRATNRFRTTGRAYTHLFLNEFFTGHAPRSSRAALEALGLGLDMSAGRSAYRFSPARIKDGMIYWIYDLEDVKDDIEFNMMENLWILEEYSPEINFFLEGRAVLTMEYHEVPELPGPPVDTPLVTVPGDLGRLVRKVADIMDGVTNYPWGCGDLGKICPSFKGLEDMIGISDSPTSLGICSSLGYDILLIDEMEDRFPLAAKELEHRNVFLHIDEIDEYSHQKDPFKKIAALERTDELMEEYFSDAERIVFFTDHGTSCVTGEHILTDVPVWTTFDCKLKEGEITPLKEVIPRILS